MKRYVGLLAGCVLAAMSTTPAFADCAAELEQLKSGDASGGIAKDGSHVPLEGAGEETSDQAMSAQDVQSQQEGGETAAQEADATGEADRTAALERAQAALQAGDEAGCMEAVEEAKSL